jgi:dihydrofolate synthase/folylpolyglutamate synthase
MLYNAWKNDQLVFENLNLPLQGIYQQKNIAGVLKGVDVLNKLGFEISNEALIRGLINVVRNTQLKGRWQKLGEHPLMICDTGHNVDGIKEIVQQISQQRYSTLYMIIGMVKDKDVTKVLSLLPKDAIYYFCQAKIPRAMEAAVLAEKAKEYNLLGAVIPNVNEAILDARRRAAKDDFIFIGGSTFVVAEIENI